MEIEPITSEHLQSAQTSAEQHMAPPLGGVGRKHYMEKPTGGFMYESSIAGAFFYMWGAYDQHHKQVGKSALMSTAQNPLDHLLGDVVARTPNDRWFIAELKRNEGGFRAEVRSKASRKNFLIDLATKKPPAAIAISSRAHFAVWANPTNFQTAEYVVKAADGLLPPKTPASTQQKNMHSKLTQPSTANLLQKRTLDFDDFYKEINEPNSARHPTNKFIFASGLGVPFDTITSYMAHLIHFEGTSISSNKEARFIMGQIREDGSFRLYCGRSFEGLDAEMKRIRTLTHTSKPHPRSRRRP